MRRSPQLRLLEIGVDPDLVERADRHQALADLDIVARIDVSARDDAIDLRDDVAVAQVEFGLGEIALGGFELGLGLLDVRRVGRQPSEGAVDVALFFELLEHLLRRLLERMDDAKLSRTLNQVGLRLRAQKKRSDRDRAEPGRDLLPSGCGGRPKEARI